MNLTINDNPLLVAPRPVRLTAAFPHFARATQLRIAPLPHDTDRVKQSEDAENIDESKQLSRNQSAASSDKESYSPRSSPRSNLPSEALEEFLSILRPAIFPPSSPVLRPRRNGAVSLPTFGVYKSKTKIDPSLTKAEQPISNVTEELDTHKQTPTCSPEPLSDHVTGNWDIFSPEITSRWHAQVLASPVSRMHTRNPFPRYATQDITFGPLSPSPTIASTPVSPAAVPLPAPSPDEVLEVS